LNRTLRIQSNVAEPARDWFGILHWSVFGLCVVQFLWVWYITLTANPRFAEQGWPVGLLLVLAAATTLTSASRHLPGQNILLAAAIIAMVSAAAHTLDGFTAIPFGPCLYTPRIGSEFFHPLPVAVPVFWIIAIFNARGVGRLTLRPWRKTRNYGFWLMGITTLLMVCFDLGLEPFATVGKRYWLWGPTRAGLYWCMTPWINFVGWAVISIVILAFITPSLINKKPSKQRTPTYHPLFVWLMLNALFVTSAATSHLWTAAIVIGLLSVATTVFAIRGARW
jgi:uncharacterized membrane protein